MTDKKIILVSLIAAAILIGALAAALQYSENASVQKPRLTNDYPVDPALEDITLSLSSGKIHGFRIENNQVFIDIDPDVDGRLVISDLRSGLGKAFPDFDLVDYVILVDNQDVAIDEIGFNVVAISVKGDSQRVEIIPLTWPIGS